MSKEKTAETLASELREVVSAPSSIEKGINIEKEKIRQFQLENDSLANSNKHRNRLVIWMTIVVSAWLLFTAVIVSIKLSSDTGLSDTETCALLTTTTANILGLAVIVLKGLFRKV